jgi:hypothetical protein
MYLKQNFAIGVIDIGPNMKLILARMLGVMYINEAL